MIPAYPMFTKLDLSHKDLVNQLTSQFDPYSDFNFVSLYSWNTNNDAEVSMLNENLVIKMPDYVTEEPIVSIIGKTKMDESIKTLLEQPLEIKLIPESVVYSLRDNPGFSVLHDLDNNDYIYELQSVADLPGGQFKKKRNKLNAFMNTYGDLVSFKEFNLQDDGKVIQLKKCFDEWAERREAAQADTDAERKAIDRLLESAHNFNLKCYEAFIDNTMVGFSINEILPHDFAICHFQKALVHHINLEIYINSLVAKHLLDEGCRLVNWEQDLGIEGLRQSKQSYAPTTVLKKYRITK